MSFSDVMSLFAVIVALFSLVLSFWASWGDRPRLKVSCVFYPAFEDAPQHFRVRAVNAGKRPVILRLFGGDYEDGWSGTYLGDSGKGLRLAENEFFEEDVFPDHHMCFDPEGSPLVRLWFEDSLGRRYPVKGSEGHVKALFADRGPGGDA